MNKILKNDNRMMIAKVLGASVANDKVFKKSNLELWVEMIAEKAGMSQPLTSHHLKVMLKSGLLSSEYRHPRTYYFLSENFERMANSESDEDIKTIGPQQSVVLEFIRKNPDIRPKDINIEGLTGVRISQILKSLLSKNLVSFETDPNIRRARFYKVKS